MSKNELSAFAAPSFTPAIATKPKQDLDRGYAPRLQLVATGNAKVVLEDKAKAGEFIIVDGADCTNLGKVVNVVLLGKLFKAVDNSGDDTIVNFDPKSDEYQSIVAKQKAKGFDSQCMIGPLYLAYNVDNECFVELYLNSKSAQREEGKLDAYVPIGPEQAKELGIEPRTPTLATLKSRFIDGKQYKWFVFDTVAGPASLDGVEPPAAEIVNKACENFYKQAVVEPVEKESRSR